MAPEHPLLKHILLIHGLGRTPLSMMVLAARLRSGGYTTSMFGYVPQVERYERIVRRLITRLESLAGDRPCAVVTHSMGGILLRSALAGSAVRPAHVVMLGPPNQPPQLARHAIRWPWWRWWTGDCGRRLADTAFYDTLPDLPVPYHIIAGTRSLNLPGPLRGVPSDGIVAVHETKPSPGHEVIEIRGTHTFMMNRRDVANEILAILDGAM